jgi:soluble lytic murein transglycosylase-like protein
VRFLGKLAAVLTFGLWRPGSGQQAARGGSTGENAFESVTDAVAVGDQDLPVEAAAEQRPRPAVTAKSARRTAGGPKASNAADNSSPEIPADIHRAIADAARKHDLPVELVTAVVKVESNFNPRAVSREGARGLMQLMPATARTLSVKNAFDIRQNLDGGCRYLKTLLDRFDGRVDLALAAYSAGPNAVEKYNGIPPYRQTRHYIAKVKRYS